MKKYFQQRSYKRHFQIFVAAILLTAAIYSCTKTDRNFSKVNYVQTIQKHRNISYADILKWNYSYDKSVSDAPKIIIDKAQEAIINNTYMIRIPLQDSKGMFYLYKYNNEVQSIFVRPNLYNGELKNIEFIDLKKSLYSVLTYKNNKKADSLYKAIIPQNNNSHNTNITSLSTNANSISSNTITAMGTFWFDLGCLLRLGIPRWDEYGDRVCYGIDWASLFDGSSYLGSQTNPPPFDAASFIAIFGVNPNYSLVSPSIWSDLNGGSSSGQYELSPTAFNYLVSTMQLDEFYSDWIIQHQHYAYQIYNYLSNEPDITNAILNSQMHFELLNSSQDYVQFNIRHNIFGDKSNVWWNDDTWLVNYFSINIDDEGIYGGNHLTAAEKQFIRNHPIYALRYKDNAEKAKSETAARFPFIQTPQNPNPYLNTKADAFRHAYWMALNTLSSNPDKAREYGIAHESETPAALYQEKDMDLYNNDKCIAIANGLTAHSQLIDIIYNALINGVLKYLSPLDYTQSPKYNPNCASCRNGFVPGTTQLIPTNQ